MIKDSNENDDGLLGARDIIVDGNVFLNWSGDVGSAFLTIGEEPVDHYHAVGVTVENNLMIGNTGDTMRAALVVRASRDIVFRHNTIVGDLPSQNYGFWFDRRDPQPPSENIVVANNVWSDPTGTMGAERGSLSFSDALRGLVQDRIFSTNLFWNGGDDLPDDEGDDGSGDMFRIGSDGERIEGDPRLPQVGVDVSLPRLRDDGAGFEDGSATVREAFERLVRNYGQPAEGSPLLDAADPDLASKHDILGHPRPSAGSAAADLGAVEID